MRIALLVASALALPSAALADPMSGPYLSLGAGWNHIQDETVSAASLEGSGTTRFNGPAHFEEGLAAVGALGWGFGNGLRAELEGSYRWNELRSITGAGSTGGNEDKYGAMVNALYDFDLGGIVTPYLGAGAGAVSVGIRNGSLAGPGYYITLQHPQMEFAYQAMAGVAVALPVEGLSLTAEYRFLGVGGDPQIYGQYFAPQAAKPANFRFTNDYNHSILVGFRYAFEAPAAPAPETPAAMPPVAMSARTYLVFFDWDRADLTDRARQIIAEAARTSTHVPTTRIDVQGNADRSGTPQYNQRLSLRRARTVAAELMRDGVARGEISIEAFGDSRPLVPTAAGVREPQNRRVAIVLQ